jgi:hypothetical protein
MTSEADTAGILWGIDWLVVTAISTAAMTFAIALTAWLALRQLRLNRQLHEEQMRPHIVIDIVPTGTSSNLLELTVTNVGKTAARNVRITLNPTVETTLRSEDKYALKNSHLLTEVIPTIAPGREIRTLFDSMPDRYQADLPLRYTATATYHDRNNQQLTDTFELDLAVLVSLLYLHKSGINEVAVALKDISRTMTRWTHAHQGLRVMNQSYEKFAWENGTLIAHPQKLLRALNQALRWITRDRLGIPPWEQRQRRFKELTQRHDEQQARSTQTPKPSTIQ